MGALLKSRAWRLSCEHFNYLPDKPFAMLKNLGNSVRTMPSVIDNHVYMPLHVWNSILFCI